MTTQPHRLYRWSLSTLHIIFVVTLILSGLWLGLALWIQQPFGSYTLYAIGLWLFFCLSTLILYIRPFKFSRRHIALSYTICIVFALLWYFSIPAKQNREWNPEVSKILSYERSGDLIRLHNIRNFDWHSDGSYTEHWETRNFNLKDIQGVNIITSYWMGPQIAHTLVSFDFKDQAPLAFSIEIRKEKTEEFSAIGGFFRKYELSLVASDEKDIIYTRSNIRHEQVYFFPVNMKQNMAQELFLEYLTKADDLAKHPKWYNTLTSNCTTLVFDMIQAVSEQPLPSDYRLLASGYLPNYLKDLNVLPHDWDMKTWYQRAHVNPKTQQKTNLSSQEYSTLIRSTVHSTF